MSNKITNIGNLNVGDIIMWDTGYSMVLPHFAVIDSFTSSGKSARITVLKSHLVSDEYGQRGYKTPTDVRTGTVKTCRIHSIDADPYVCVDGCYSHKWNGEPALYDTMD